MVTDKQVRRLMKMVETGESLQLLALKTGMDEKTARKYKRAKRLPSQIKKEHQWRTRKAPFTGVWEEIREQLEQFPGLEAKTLCSVETRWSTQGTPD
jgi:Zn-dependent M32 family carboxypeptidase